jgi:hypothetical protein
MGTISATVAIAELFSYFTPRNAVLGRSRRKLFVSLCRAHLCVENKGNQKRARETAQLHRLSLGCSIALPFVKTLRGLPPSLPFSAEALARFSDLSERKALAASSLVIGSPHFGQFIDF